MAADTLYLSIADMNKKSRLKSSIYIRTWGQEGSDDKQFSYPYGVAVGCDGTIYVSDSENNRIQCFNRNGTFLHKWGRRGDRDGEFKFPTGLAIGLWNGMNESIKSAMMMVPSLASFPPGVLPICVAYIGSECLYCTDFHANRVQVFGMDGRFILKWGSAGNGDGEFHGSWSCAVSSRDGMVYVSDTFNHRIQVFDSEGRFIRKWGTYGGGPHQLRYPHGISVSRDLSGAGSQMIYIDDQQNNRVVCYHVDGTPAHEWKPSTGLLHGPMGVMVDDDNALNGIGVVYVVDTYNNCIRKYGLDGSLIKSWDRKGKGDRKFWRPSGIARGVNPIDGRPIIYIADTYNHRIVVINRF